jgi:putative transposase
MQNKTADLIPGALYHIYNRANGNEKLFLTADNYYYFLRKYKSYLQPVADTFCYCLMPNHFHFLIRIKSESELRLCKGDLENLVSRQFSNFFNSYSKSFNKQHNRMGNLFMRAFKRKRVCDHDYLQNLIYYIHHNPTSAKLSKKPEDYPYSSYRELTTNQTGILCKKEILEWFGGPDNFIAVHEKGVSSFMPDPSGFTEIFDKPNESDRS